MAPTDPLQYKCVSMNLLRARIHAALGGLPSAFWMLFWGLLINRSASFVVTFLSVHLKQDLGLSHAEAGRVVGLWGLGSTLAALVGGVMADRVGRRITMLLGLVLGGLCVVAIACTTTPHWAAVFALAGGAAQALYFPASNAAVADIVPPEHRARAYGHLYWAANMGLASGYFAAGFVHTRSVVPLFLADATTTFLCAVLTAWRVPETRPIGGVHGDAGPAGLVAVLRDRTFTKFVLLHLAALVVFTQFQLALPLDMAAHGVGPQRFSWLMAFNCIGVVLLQPWLAPLLRRFDPSRLLAISVLLFGIGYGLNAFVSTFPLYLLGAAFWTVGEVVGFPAASALTADLSPTGMRGRYQGTFSMAWGCAMTLSPVLGGQIMDKFGSRVLWSLSIVVAAAVAAGHLFSAPARRRRLAAIATADERPRGALAS